MRNERKRNPFNRSEISRGSELAVAVSAGVLAMIGRANAATLYWDGSGAGAVGNPPTTINGGTIIVDGSIASSSLTTVNTSGTLGGSGTVGNSVISGGTLAPGSPAGSIFGPLGVQSLPAGTV